MATVTAKNVMTSSVVSVGPETPLADVLRLFVEENIHGAPVVGDDGEFVGVISTSDLLRAEDDERDTAAVANDYLREVLEFSSPDWAGGPTDFQDRLAQRTVADVMTEDFVSVECETPVTEIARCLRIHRIHRVWVEEDGRVCGVVSALDLMPVIEQGAGRVG